MSVSSITYLFGIGVGSAFTLCSVFCVPVTTAYLMVRQHNVAQGLLAATIIGASRLIGLSLIGVAGGVLGRYSIALASRLTASLVPIAAVLLLVLGLVVLSGKEPHMALCPKYLARTGHYWFDLCVLGLLMAFVPCATHFAVLAYISVVATDWLGGLILGASFGLGNMLSLFVAGIFAGATSSVLRRSNWSYAMRLVCGGLLALAGLQQIIRHLWL